MEKLTAILIDDELNSLENLQQKLTEYCPVIQILAKTQLPEEGCRLITRYKPDVIFLDIEMPHMNGFTLLDKLDSIDSEIIFTTAYDQYTINAIRISAFDYLLKPVAINELQLAVERLLVQSGKESNERYDVLKKCLDDIGATLIQKQNLKIPVPCREGVEFFMINSILRIESSTNYSNIVLNDGKTVLVTKLLKEFEEMLVGYGFFRIHNSHLINLFFLKKYLKGDGGQVLMQNGDIIDVSRRKKEAFMKHLRI